QRRGQPIELVRNGSRGAYWLEPLVEVLVDGVRHAYGPITQADVPSLFDAEFIDGRGHAKALGPTEEIPYLAQQTRLTFARVGLTEPLSIDDYRAHDCFRGLEKAVAL